jgi:hypothetical protein
LEKQLKDYHILTKLLKKNLKDLKKSKKIVNTIIKKEKEDLDLDLNLNTIEIKNQNLKE